MRLVRMTHPDIPQPIDVPESAVPLHMASGWAPKEKGDPIPAAAVASGPVDPPGPPTPVGVEALAAAAETPESPSRGKR